MPVAAGLLLVLGALPASVDAQTGDYFPGGQSFDASIPLPAEFLGYEVGTFHTRHDRIVAYMRELAERSPLATYQTIGTTWEHRPMPVLTVTSKSNHGRLEEIRRRHLVASDPAAEAPGTRDGAASEEPTDPYSLPVVVHLGYGVHGDEASSAEAAMLTAYWLVAGRSPEVERYRRQGVYHVEPVLNPDGRDRHTQWVNGHRAQPLVADEWDREHNQAWPGGRTNHYWFDLNRDWLPLVNPESRARIDFHHRWRPNVVTDYHEMGSSSTYFFEPSEPVGSWNPLLPERLYTDITLRFSDDWAASLDTLGSLYFTREVYDNTYPGYGSTYPNFLGGLGLVFEQASSDGHRVESDHHGEISFPFAIRNHLRTSMATVATAVEERDTLRAYQRDFFASAREEAAESDVSGWIFGDPTDATLNRDFLELLLRHRLRVHELSAPVEVEGTDFRPGSAWVVPARQPHYRLARSIFERTESFADSVFYDASTWTVSLAYGIPDGRLRTDDLPLGERVTEPPAPPGPESVARSSISYLVDWRDSDAPRALQALLARGLRVEFSMEPFTARTTGGEVELGRGSISVPVGVQEMDADAVHRAVTAARAEVEVPIHSATTAMTPEGVDLGSRSFHSLTERRVLMPVGEGISAYEAGQIWHLLDTRVRLPVTKVDVDDVDRVRWADYDVVVLVSGDHGYLSGETLADLKAWVRDGGTLVATRTGAAWAARHGFTPRIGEPGVGAWPEGSTSEGAEAGEAREVGDGSDGEEAAGAPERRDYADADEIEGAQEIGGSIWEADLDVTHPLGFGYTRRFLPVWRDHELFFAPSENPYSTVARLTGDPHLSGYASDENRERLAGSPSVMSDALGDGTVVLLVDNPNFRGYWRGTNRLLLNALFFGEAIEVP